MYKFIDNVKIVRISLDLTKRYCGSNSTSTYYDILEIPKDASKKDVREAFIKLSKKIHPDKSSETSAKSHNDFIKINEAYRILSKDYSRQQYDLHLKYYQAQGPSSYRAYNSPGDDGYGRSNAYYHDNLFYHGVHRARARHHHQRQASFSNDKYFTPARILLYCFMLSLVGTVAQIWAIMKSPVFNRDQMNRRSESYFNEYRRVRNQVVNKSHTKVLDDLRLSDTDFDSKSNSDNDDDHYVKADAEEIKW